jgi:PncC family amidohydrolase
MSNLNGLLKNELKSNYISIDDAPVINNMINTNNDNNTLSIAESITCGKLASLISSTNRASSFFIGGIICYSSKIKENVLGISNKILEPCNCVSIEVAQEMAKSISNLMNTTYGVSTTGYAEPPTAYEKYIENKGMVDVPHAYICLYNSNTKKYSYKLVMDFENRTYVEMQEYVAKEAHDLYLKRDI